jgi:hypothetical protein
VCRYSRAEPATVSESQVNAMDALSENSEFATILQRGQWASELKMFKELQTREMGGAERRT